MHTAKLVIYSDDRPYDVSSWKKSICRAFSEISDITLKPKGKRFSVESYWDQILGIFGDTPNDAKNFLAYGRAKLITLSDPYPDKEISPEMIDTCLTLVNLYTLFCEMLASSDSQIPYDVFKTKLDEVI